MKKIILLAIVISSLQVSAQNTGKTDSRPVIDTAAVLDSMAKDIAMLQDLMEEKSSYVNLNLNIGNELFSSNNVSLNAQQGTTNSLNLKPSIGYYHKSGLSINGLAFMNLNHTDQGFYQYAITPAFDLQSKGYINAGASFTHYFTGSQDTLLDYASPYDNEVYLYANATSGALQPGLTIGYATGKYTSIFRGRVMLPTGGQVFVVDSQRTKLRDLSITASVQHDFYFPSVFSEDDELSFTPSLLLNAGDSKTTILSHSNRLVANIAAKRPNNRFKVQNEGFQFYSVGLSLTGTYSIGKFYVQPDLYFDYYLQTADKKFTSLYSLSVGVNL